MSPQGNSRQGRATDTKTVPEVTSWFKSSLAGHWFDCHAKSIKCLQTEQPENWRVDFETWTEEKPDTFQGLHNQGRRIIMVFDEGSAIASVIYDAAETSFTDENTEFIFLVFGNPLYNTGRFRELFGVHAHLWRTYQIDSRTVEGVKREQADEWVASYGEDSDFVRVKVRGEFPRAGSSQFIPSDIVAACRKYRAEGYEALPKILSVDVARFGDDQTVIGYRQGRKSAILGKYRGKDTVWVAEETIRLIERRSRMPQSLMETGLGRELLTTLSTVVSVKDFLSFMEANPQMMDQPILTAVLKCGAVYVLGSKLTQKSPTIPNSTQILQESSTDSVPKDSFS
jgi:hypothetical protein